jgi:HD-like signal output (HDOD) protein
MEKLSPIQIDPKTFLREHCALPALPVVISRIQEMIQSNEADIGKITDLIMRDPSLVAQVLKVVNSSYYSLPREVVEVRYAIAFLGLNEVYRIVLSLSVVHTLGVKEKAELDRFWFHSFFTALCTKDLARRHAPHVSLHELWSAAILHDIGKLVYLRFFPEHYRALAAICKERGCLFSEAEQQLGLPASAYFGTLLCDHWRLPVKVRDACEFHTLKDLVAISPDTPSGECIRIICLGNLMAVLASDHLGEQTKLDIAKAIQSALQYTESQFLTVMGAIYELKIEAEKFSA